MTKLAHEEARVHPRRTLIKDGTMSDSETIGTKRDPKFIDPKLSYCLESYIQWFNRLTFFVTTEIVKHTQRRSRVRLIHYFIDAAYQCFRFHNFNSMIAILGITSLSLSLFISPSRLFRWSQYATRSTIKKDR